MKPLTPAQAKDIAGGALTQGPDGDYFEYDCDPNPRADPTEPDLVPDATTK